MQQACWGRESRGRQSELIQSVAILHRLYGGGRCAVCYCVFVSMCVCRGTRGEGEGERLCDAIGRLVDDQAERKSSVMELFLLFVAMSGCCRCIHV